MFIARHFDKSFHYNLDMFFSCTSIALHTQGFLFKYGPSPATVSTQHQPISLGLNMSDLDPIGHGSASDYGSKGPRFDSRCRWELGFSLSSLSYLLISGTSLIRSLVDVQYYLLVFNFQEKF